MTKVKIVLNRSGVRELLKSEEMMSIVKQHADETKKALRDGYVVTTQVGRNRVNAEIATETIQSMVDNSKNNSILKALR